MKGWLSKDNLSRLMTPNRLLKSRTVLSYGPSGPIGLAEWALARMADFGVKIPAGNRLQRAVKLLSEVESGRRKLTQVDEELLVRVAEAQLTIKQMYLITRSMGSRPGQIDPLRQFKLREMLGGQDIEDQEKKPIARNTQFELFVAALMTMGGATVLLGEPDIRMKNGLLDVGIAAKRLSSPQKRAFLDRVQEGGRQILRQGGEGFVAVNIDSTVKRREDIGDKREVVEHQIERFRSCVKNLNSSLRVKDHLLGVLYLSLFTRACGISPRRICAAWRSLSLQAPSKYSSVWPRE